METTTTETEELIWLKMDQMRCYAQGINDGLIAEDKHFDQKIHSLNERGYLSSSKELNGYLVRDLAIGDRKGWDIFKYTYDELDEKMRAIYRPNLGYVKHYIGDLLSAKPMNPNGLPYVPIVGGVKSPELLKEVYTEIERLEADSKASRDDYINGFAFGTALVGTMIPGLPGKIVSGVGAGVGFVHHGSRIYADEAAQKRIDENNRKIAEEKQRQQELKEKQKNRLSQTARDYVDMGVTQ